MNETRERIAVVGAGLVGSLWALMLTRRGYTVDIFDRRPDPRTAGDLGGRSINLALSERGWKALDLAGVQDEVREISMPVKGRRMHGLDGGLTFQPYGRAEGGRFGEGECIYSVARGSLNRLLLEAAEKTGQAQVHFNHKLEDYRQDDEGVTLNFGAGGERKADRLFGTDGVFSAVRMRMMKGDRFDSSLEYLKHGYKELELKADDQGGFQLPSDGLHIWPRGHFMLMALPNPDGSFTCTLFAPFEGPDSFEEITDSDAALAYFKKHFPDFVPLMPDLKSQWDSHPKSSMAMVKCAPWHEGDRVALVGDSAHAIVPFYGQGMNCGFEDCTVLDGLMDGFLDAKSGGHWGEMLAQYSELRKENGDAILELALRNFIEMRDLTGDPMFLLQKRIEGRIAQEHPDRWVPLYSQVTFTHIDYAEALKRGNRQRAIMRQVMDRPDIENVSDSPEIVAQAIALLQEDA